MDSIPTYLAAILLSPKLSLFFKSYTIRNCVIGVYVCYGWGVVKGQCKFSTFRESCCVEESSRIVLVWSVCECVGDMGWVCLFVCLFLAFV